MPRTLSRSILGILEFLGVDVSGRGANVSDEIQLGFPISDFSEAELIPHFGSRYATGVVPAGKLRTLRLTAPPDRGIRILSVRNEGNANIQLAISASDVGQGYSPLLAAAETWNGTPLTVVQIGNLDVPPGIGFFAQLANLANFGGANTHGHVISSHPIFVPPAHFFYIAGSFANSTNAGSILFSEPIPRVPVRTGPLTSHG